ncbi:MAG: S4 domain-containing protein YaaA [Bacilli bacterium]
MKIVKIDTEFITLGQFLKFVGIIDSGATAKTYLLSHFAVINGEKEQRRGKKLYPGMIFFINNEQFKIESL